MIIKDKIQIGGIWWKIKFEDHLKDGGESINGLTDLDEATIALDNLLDIEDEKHRRQIIEDNFWHEINHVILFIAGYKFNDELKHDEHLINAETPVLHQIMNQIINWQLEDK